MGIGQLRYHINTQDQSTNISLLTNIYPGRELNPVDLRQSESLTATPFAHQ